MGDIDSQPLFSEKQAIATNTTFDILQSFPAFFLFAHEGGRDVPLP